MTLDMTHTALGLSALATFIVAYICVMGEEFFLMKKSEPVVFAAGILWVLVAIAARSKGMGVAASEAVLHNHLEFSELFLFLFVAMIYVSTMEERKVFLALKAWIVKHRFSYRTLFWITGFLAFFISPLADNMTTALIMCAIVMALGEGKKQFIALSCINIVVAANAGGAFSPFGDITTLMVWQKEILPFMDFFKLFLPSLVNFVVPAAIMHFSIPKGVPHSIEEKVFIEPGGLMVVLLFLLTILGAVCLHHFFNLPPTVGMMTGFAFLQIFGFILRRRYLKIENKHPFDIFQLTRNIEWDTLLFFYGVILCVGALASLGYLALLSDTLYGTWGKGLSAMHQQTPANVVIGLLSAIVDNIPLMFAVLTMQPKMSEGQWLLVTLTAGVGGSLLSIGSAAGVALMGQSKGQYTFLSHFKWSWAILLGYAASIVCHFVINRATF